VAIENISLPSPLLSRRGLLRSSMLAGAVGLGIDAIGVQPSAAAATFVKGADVSWLPQMEAAGYTFKNAAGTTQDLLTILKGYGINAIRLRTFVNPSSDPVNGHCSIDETAAMALRVKQAGMQVLIDYHFGDTWNSVGVQKPPAAWASMTYAQMQTAMYNYVFHTMNVIKTKGVTPAWVQIGNEINTGICRPTGAVSNGAQMTGLLNAAYEMVKTVYPSTPVMIHLAQPQNFSVIQTFFSTYAANGGKWDLNGFSSYGAASVAAAIVANMQSISATYGKPFMQVEVGGAVAKVSSTEAAVKAYLTALMNAGGQGCFYWEPEVMTPFASYAMGAWNSATGQPTAIMDAFSQV
jgi:arabinogalactan endo-1,4-beta-galactosidase